MPEIGRSRSDEIVERTHMRQISHLIPRHQQERVVRFVERETQHQARIEFAQHARQGPTAEPAPDGAGDVESYGNGAGDGDPNGDDDR